MSGVDPLAGCCALAVSQLTVAEKQQVFAPRARFSEKVCAIPSWLTYLFTPTDSSRDSSVTSYCARAWILQIIQN